MLNKICLIALEEEESHEVDVVGELLDLDDVGKRHFGLLTDSELLPCVGVGLLILLVNLTLAQVVVLDESFTCAELIAAIVLATHLFGGFKERLLLGTAEALELLEVE